MNNLLAAKRLIIPYVNCTNTDPLASINKLFCGWYVRDRFNLLNKYSPLKWYDKVLPEDQEFLDNRDKEIPYFNEIMDNKVHYFGTKWNHVNILWSGGVDSTALLCGFMKWYDKSKFTVFCTDNSRLEYPWLYEKLKKEGYDMIIDDAVISRCNEREGVILSGWCADQLFGSNIHLLDLDNYNKPWLEGFESFWNQRGYSLSNKSKQVLKEVFDGYASFLGLKLTTFSEFAWLMNFGIKWTSVSADTLLGGYTDDLIDRSSEIFYADTDFQVWSLRDYPNISRWEVNRFTKFYKRPLKQYIYQYTNDEDYFKHKGKQNSWMTVYDTAFESISYYYIDTDGTRKRKFCHISPDKDIYKTINISSREWIKEGKLLEGNYAQRHPEKFTTDPDSWLNLYRPHP